MRGALMESEIRQQPEILSSNANSYFQQALPLQDQNFEMVLLAARGTSDNAALYARYLFEIQLGIPVSLSAPSVITKHRTDIRYPKCLAIGISQSGAAPDVAEVLAAMRRNGHTTLAITNTEGSRLTEEAEHTILLNAGPEKAVAATKTYTTSLLALYQTARALGANLPDPQDSLPNEEWLETCRNAAEESAGTIVRQSVLFALGRGYGFATCQETALKLMECALLPAKAFSTADFQHGPKALAGHESAAIVYGEVPDGLAEQGCEIVRAPAGLSTPVGPIHEILFGQWIALLTARARGLDPDQPRNLSKVTLTL
ncbi:MAG: SIS domain-containing protein [Armatimonadetes bacterium]|nr:SIS domain-containing protein [Armatimonadota bacterium]